MEQLNEQSFSHYTESDEIKWPSGLKKASQIAEQLNLSEQRILELADSQYIPHWRIDGGDPLFQIQETKKWVAKNILNRIDGTDLPVHLKLMISPPEAKEAPPEIRETPNLREVPIFDCYPPGVYFLVKDNTVVYVGQSLNPLARVGAHMRTKDFDRAYMIPVPSSLLNSVEGAIIRAMNPLLNSPNRDIAVGPGDKGNDDRIIDEYAPNLREFLSEFRQ
jgi:hypothetical protein